MQAFSYVPARTLSEAAEILAREGEQAKCLSGGTDLIVFLREGRRSAKVVVDVKGIPELNQLSYSPKEGLTVGAAVPLHRIYNDAQVIAHYPGLIDAATLIGGIAIQGRATLGGNVCTASPAGDSSPILIAYEATCVVASRNVTKAIPLEKFFLGPGRTVLQPGELLVALKLPPPRPNSGAAYLRFIPRNEMDIAVTSAGAMVVLDEEKTHFVGARIALGAVAPTPLFVPEAGAALAGQPISDEAIEAAARAAQAAARPITDMRGSAEQRKHLSYVMTKRALLRAIERARGG
ncbi:MAG: dehydrogenase [Candidatus Roseilinea sp.]|nr:MAG: dehydrogenase [Candidatus Roseilinea sp.]